MKAATTAVIGGGVALALSALLIATVPASEQVTPEDPVGRLGLQPSFAEEFNGTSVEPRKWNTGRNDDTVAKRSLYTNGEHQIYLNPGFLGINQQPLTVAGGWLTITAKPLTPAERSVVQAQVRLLPPDQANSPLKDIEYGSGALNTRGHFDQKYGYFEIRARFPEGKGLWPTLWLLPADGSWPPEIDIVEVLGHDPQTAYLTIHATGVQARSNTYKLTPSADGFHRYGVLWTPTAVDYYVDGVKAASDKTPREFNQPMFLYANLAVGGYWPGYPDANTKFPARMDIDYIRAWKFPKSPAR